MALAAVEADRREHLDPLLTRHGGRVFKTMGDGLLVEFASVVEAVRCALAIQQDLLKRHEGSAPEHRMYYRLGIHLGDVVAAGDDRSEEHTSELQSLMRISYAVFCLKKKKNIKEASTTTP